MCESLTILHTSKLLYPSFHFRVCAMAIPATPAPTMIVFGRDIVPEKRKKQKREGFFDKRNLNPKNN
jgi:hypothetical protein